MALPSAVYINWPVVMTPSTSRIKQMKEAIGE
jgi:hypothetical protein